MQKQRLPIISSVARLLNTIAAKGINIYSFPGKHGGTLYVSRLFYKFFLGLIILAISVQETRAQLALKSQEVWPSVDMYYRINQKFRVYGTFGGTKLDESSYTDGAIGVFVDHFTFPVTNIFRPSRPDSLPGKFLWLRVGYQYSATPPSAEDPFEESMIVTEANARYYLPHQILLTWKNRFDWRFKNGEFDLRYRPRLVFEKDLKTEYLNFTAYGFGEYFLNFGSSSVNRLRTQLGVEIKVFKRMNYEVFWNHQFSNQPEVQEVDAFGMCLKIYIDHKDVKGYIEKKKSKKKEKKEKK
jgi:Protein of unknown function (DUF2490)